MLRWRFAERVKKQLVTVSRSRLTLRCPKHPRFNPAQGVGAIKANCPGCHHTVLAYTSALKLQEALGDYMRNTEKYEAYKLRTKSTQPLATV